MTAPDRICGRVAAPASLPKSDMAFPGCVPVRPKSAVVRWAAAGSLACHEVISVLRQYSRYKNRWGTGKGLRTGPPRASQLVMVFGGAPVMAAAPAMSSQQSSPGSSGRPKSRPAGTGLPSRMASLSAPACACNLIEPLPVLSTAPPITVLELQCPRCRVGHRSCVRFQPVRLTALATPSGVPRRSRLSGLAARGEAELLAAKLDLLALDAVVQRDAHDAHCLTRGKRERPCACQLAEDMHLRRS